MAALQELEVLLNRVTQSAIGADTVVRKTVSEIGDGVTLVCGIFPYARRAIGVPGRLLTTEVTRQPVLAVREQDRITPLAYAEDVVGHPLRDVLVGQLKTICQPGGPP